MVKARVSRMKKNKGFSLVELAIVLVIIGLITGGILTGQELIRSSELANFSMTVNKFRVAVSTFKLKYNSLPGDLNNAFAYWPSAGCTNAVTTFDNQSGCNGNANGQINISGSAGGVLESYRYWHHLSLSGIIPGNFIGTGIGGNNSLTDSAGVNTPKLPINGVCFLSSYGGNITSGTSRYYGFYPNLWDVGDASTSGRCYGNFLTPAEAQSVDAKVDDGKPGIGIIRTFPGDCATNTASDPSGAAYMLSTQTISCNFTINQ